MARTPIEVAKKAQAADDMIRGLGGEASVAAMAAAAGEPAAIEVAPPPEPAALTSEPDEGLPGAQADLDEPPSPEGSEPPAPSGEEAPDDAGYQHRFKVLQGKYNAEVRDVREENKDLRRRLTNMETLLATLSSKPADPAPAAPVAPPAPEKEPEPRVAKVSVPAVTQREKEDFGEDLLDAAARTAMAMVAPLIDDMAARLAKLQRRVDVVATTAETTQSTVHASTTKQMLDFLDREMPEWRKINKKPAFVEWLREEDGMSGELRQHLLLRAYEKNDAARVLRFFRSFVEHASEPEAAAASAPATQPNPVPAAGKPAAVDPATLVAPGRGRNAPTNGAQQIVWTPKDIAAFYADVAAGAFKNNPEHRAALESDIFAAQRDGRVLVS